MEEFEFSLLYPSRASREAHAAAHARPNVSAETVESLGLSSLIKLKNSSLVEYFTSDPAVIAYRAENFGDMLAHGEIADLAQARAIIAASTPMAAYQPKDAEVWQQAYDRYRALTGRN